MAELMGLAQIVLSKIRNHEHAWVFMEPVDARALGLWDYHAVIKKPMDLGSIQHRMDAQDGTGYRNVKEVCNDVRLVFYNALLYNDAGSDAHMMAKVRSAKFEEQWKAFVEPTRQEEELKWTVELRKADAMQLVLTIAEQHAFQTLKDSLSSPLFKNLKNQLEDLKQLKRTPPSSTPISIEEQSELCVCLGSLSRDKQLGAIHILAQENSGFNVNTFAFLLWINTTGAEVTADIYGLESPTIWRLYRYVMADFAVMRTPLSG